MQAEALALAKTIEEVRLRRRNFFGSGLFDEHAWDLLLVLFIASEEDRAVSRDEVLGVVVGSEALLDRWILLLERDGEIERSDAPVEELRISPEGKRKMLQSLSSSIAAR